MTNQDGRRQWRRTKEKRLKPRQNADGERTVKKQVLQRLTRSRTKARQRNIITKRGQAFGSIENPMGHLPGKVNNGTIKIKKEKLTPSGGPIKRTKKRKKLPHTVGRNNQLRKKKPISRSTGQRNNRARKNTGADAKTRSPKGSPKRNPG